MTFSAIEVAVIKQEDLSQERISLLASLNTLLENGAFDGSYHINQAIHGLSKLIESSVYESLKLIEDNKSHQFQRAYLESFITSQNVTPLPEGAGLHVNTHYVFTAGWNLKHQCGIKIFKDDNGDITVMFANDFNSYGGTTNSIESLATMIGYEYNLDPAKTKWIESYSPYKFSGVFEGKILVVSFNQTEQISGRGQDLDSV